MPSDAIAQPTPGLRHRRSAIIAVVLLVAAVGWYAWPGISGDHGDVVVITDADHAAVTPHLVAEVRDRGRDVTALGEVDDWCSLAVEVPTLPLSDDVDVLVVAITERGDCAGDPMAAVVDALDRRSVAAVIVVPPGQSAPAVDARTVPVLELLGPPSATTVECEWWDECAPGESVRVRSAAGQLTDAGADRIARMVAATIG